MKSSNTLTPFGKLVVKALVDQDMTKTELAGQIGTSPQHLSRILHGTRPGGKHIPAIVAALALGLLFLQGRKMLCLRLPGRDGSAGRIYHAGGGRSL